MDICILDCDHDEGIDNTALRIKKIIGKDNCHLFKVKNNEFPESLNDFDGVISTGSSSNTVDDEKWIRRLMKILDTRIPVLGICFSHQLIAQMLGGSVGKLYNRNFGYENVTLTPEGIHHPLFTGLNNPITTFFTHMYYVKKLPKNTKILANDKSINIGFNKGNYIGLQFHPDITWKMAKRLAQTRDLELKKPPEYLLNKSSQQNRAIILNFVEMVRKHK